VADSLQDDDPVFGWQTANLIGLHRACLDEALAGRMHRQDRGFYSGFSVSSVMP
jgi:hypothetical protein